MNSGGLLVKSGELSPTDSGTANHSKSGSLVRRDWARDICHCERTVRDARYDHAPISDAVTIKNCESFRRAGPNSISLIQSQRSNVVVWKGRIASCEFRPLLARFLRRPNPQVALYVISTTESKK